MRRILPVVCGYRRLRQKYCMYIVATRSSSADEITNMNFFNDDIVHVLQNTINSRMNSATGRRFSSQPEAKHSKHQNKKRNGKAKFKR